MLIVHSRARKYFQLIFPSMLMWPLPFCRQALLDRLLSTHLRHFRSTRWHTNSKKNTCSCTRNNPQCPMPYVCLRQCHCKDSLSVALKNYLTFYFRQWYTVVCLPCSRLKICLTLGRKWVITITELSFIIWTWSKFYTR